MGAVFHQPDLVRAIETGYVNPALIRLECKI